MASVVPHELASQVLTAYLSGKTVKAALLNAHTPDVDKGRWADVSADQISAGNGYTAGGVAVTPAVSDSDANDNAVLDISDPSWTASGGNIGPFTHVVVYDDTSTEKIIFKVIDLGGSVTITDGNTWSVQIDAAGLVRFQQA